MRLRKFLKTTFERGKRNAETMLRHLFKWADECLVEEVEDIKSLISGMNKDISEFRLNVALLEKEIEVMKTESEGKGEECMSQGRCLRNVRHLFKWADECLVEEVEDIKSLISGMNKDISEFRLNVVRLEKEIEVMKTESEGKGEECVS
ncbi:hypothetical protein F2Q70_00004472 [Brassica cretica]|uniref:Uncharacterized protein n=1 Tax=Brassica cretica TaxID=69181 RepID=A0A8S9J0K8_BRACR|nr:hypothetical protein F2Q68_00021330 [Brassica cretica]KAF2575930.1 hypothetical protein F2Q70_00004472 [Brassica cretica]